MRRKRGEIWREVSCITASCLQQPGAAAAYPLGLKHASCRVYDWLFQQKFRHENEKKPDVVKTSGFFESGSSTWARTRDLRINRQYVRRVQRENVSISKKKDVGYIFHCFHGIDRGGPHS
jgi:hypothetical protein